MAFLKQTKVVKPDIVELMLVAILAIWGTIVFWLIEKAITFPLLNSITWQSLTTLFVGFMTIVMLVIAILLADIRKELKHPYQ
jgi:predicted ferric reductase